MSDCTTCTKLQSPSKQ
uniref:Uncharacterized protein n=1 Tax=Anguilla anguilla TaxID=7936 RepID=A0A0E9UUJ9_ANGAN